MIHSQLTPGLLVVDTSTKLTASEAKALKAAGVAGVFRYVFFGSPRPGDIDADELQLLTEAGLTVCLVQHVRNPGWRGSAMTGTGDAGAAMANAIRAGYVSPSGGPLLAMGLDLEGIGEGGPDHAQAWCSTLAGYRPLVYVGYASGMTTAVLDSLAGDPSFWADFAPISQRPVPTKLYAMHQHAQSAIAGIGVDRDDILQPGIYGLATGDPAAGGENDPAA